MRINQRKSFKRDSLQLMKDKFIEFRCRTNREGVSWQDLRDCSTGEESILIVRAWDKREREGLIFICLLIRKDLSEGENIKIWLIFVVKSLHFD
jgi:hypothetical protein